MENQEPVIVGIHSEKTKIIETIAEIRIFTKDWVFVLDKLSGRWSAVRNEIVTNTHLESNLGG